ncbi:hypothetical protein NQ317_007690 [Molorchus minor]|uniref:DUF5641 domain-containing protein n=1 Tax=Molorchus minor TaxID=1323400 RepID=A0ABQ9JPD3_9CUCU|nr:hypothetical protein NQ317_007690 [Molorchus minor]
MYDCYTPVHNTCLHSFVKDFGHPNLINVPSNRLSHFEHVQKLQQHFWSRWSREYISELQHRSKWPKEHGCLKVNDLVVIKEDKQPPLKWSLGRIASLHPGRDGVSRVATIRTSAGLIKRSFSKICPLPVSDECSVSGSELATANPSVE